MIVAQSDLRILILVCLALSSQFIICFSQDNTIPADYISERITVEDGIQGGWEGSGNMDTVTMFEEGSFIIAENSPVIGNRYIPAHMIQVLESSGLLDYLYLIQYHSTLIQ